VNHQKLTGPGQAVFTARASVWSGSVGEVSVKQEEHGVTHTHLGAPMRRMLVPLAIAASACTTTHKTSTGRTERETDSVIGQSSIPGASAVRKAMAAQDTARAQAAAVDTAAARE
jgi:hypothetical protein